MTQLSVFSTALILTGQVICPFDREAAVANQFGASDYKDLHFLLGKRSNFLTLVYNKIRYTPRHKRFFQSRYLL